MTPDKFGEKIDEFKPGDTVPTSGIYDVIHDKLDGDDHANPHQVTAIAGMVFPPCRGCNGWVRFRLHQAAEHVETHGLLMEATHTPQTTIKTNTNFLAAAPIGRIADPDPLGLFGFAFATLLANVGALGVYSFNAMWLTTTFFLGGLIQLIAGLADYKRNNIFGATVFSFFGATWLGLGITAWFVYLNVVPKTDPVSQGWFCALFVVFVGAMTGASLKLNKVLTSALLIFLMFELLQAIGSFTGVMLITKAGAVCGIISAVVAIYLATSDLWNRALGKIVLPVGQWKH
jgi:uncharacterized protein